VLGQDANDLRHLRFDPGEALSGFMLKLKMAPFEFEARSCTLGETAHKRRLVLGQRRQRFF
jgi:hypothetical protein